LAEVDLSEGDEGFDVDALEKFFWKFVHAKGTEREAAERAY
jgi:hypothetical protein